MVDLRRYLTIISFFLVVLPYLCKQLAFQLFICSNLSTTSMDLTLNQLMSELGSERSLFQVAIRLNLVWLLLLVVLSHVMNLIGRLNVLKTSSIRSARKQSVLFYFFHQTRNGISRKWPRYGHGMRVNARVANTTELARKKNKQKTDEIQRCNWQQTGDVPTAPY